METVNLSRAVLVCNTFHFCFAAAKASLVPFLTLFCRLMGLSATETGVIMAVKTITGFIWAPVWSRCAIAYNKRRTILMFSIFVMAATYLSLSIVFSQVKDQEEACSWSPHPLDGHSNSSYISSSVPTSVPSAHPPVNLSNLESTTVGRKDNLPKLTSLLTKITKATTTPGSTTTKETATVVTTHPPTPLPVDELNKTTESLSHQGKTKGPSSHQEVVDVIKNMLENLGFSVQDIKDNNRTPEEMFQVIDLNYPHSGLTLDLFRELWPQLMNSSGEGHPRRNVQKRGIQQSWNAVKEKMSSLLSEIEKRKMQVFAIILAIIVFGEFFCSPVEKVADDAWFDFLDRVDDLEKYGKQRLSGSVAFILLPIAVTVAVDYTECLLPFRVHHFLIHFYIYGAFLGLTFLMAFFYPVPPPHKQKTKSKVLRGLQIVCCDCRGFLYVITLLIMGITYASVHVFLFWVIQDRGGSEVNMGLCVTIGAVAEIPMLMFSGKMVNKIGNAGVVTVSLLAMAVRTLYYSFLQIPWAVLPAELTHAFTHTAMWYAVLSYEDFNVGPGIDRSIRSILSSIYFGVGFSLGSVFSGMIYDLFGSAVMYWSGSVLTGVWAVFFFAISLCLPKKEKIRYVRLLRTEDTEDSDGDADDWLEMALKDQ